MKNKLYIKKINIFCAICFRSLSISQLRFFLVVVYPFYRGKIG